MMRRHGVTVALAALCVTSGCARPSAGAPGGVVRVAAHYTPAQAAPLLACFRRYEASHKGVRIDYQQVSYRDYLQTTLTSRVGRAPADIYSLYSIWAPQLIGVGALDRPPADVERFVRAAYTPATVRAATIGGRLYGVPSAVSVYQLVYNRRLLAAAGFAAPPRTWAELERIGAATTRRNRQGTVLVGGFAFGPTVANVSHVFYAQMDAAGVPPFTPDLKGTNLRSPAATRIVSEQAALFRRGITSQAVSPESFAGGAAAMTILANWQKSTLATAFGDRFARDVGVAPIPTDGPGGTMIYSFFWGVDAGSRAKRQAWDLIRWLNEARASGGLSCTGAMLAGMGDLTGNRADLAAMRRDLADPFSRGYVAALTAPGARAQDNVWHAEEVDRLLQYYLQLAWFGRMAPAAALAAADRQIRAILAEQPR